jgi:preprotein translocase subunit SecG
MLTLVTVVHLLLAVILIGLVLLQDPKGGGAFGMGGGSATQGIFGASGAGNFLVTGTKWIATLFACSCLAMSYLTIQKDASVVDGFVPPAAPAAAAPGAPDTKAPETQGKPGTPEKAP